MKFRERGIWPSSLLAVSLIAALLGSVARAAEPASILINNVRLIDRQGKADDVVVNLLIKDGKLFVVTEEKVSSDQAELAVDAQNGFLLGNLDMGSPPAFLILDEDPRRNFEVLLDTRNHTLFAVHKGAIVHNDLPVVVVAESAQEPKRSGWLTYEPPPLALPLEYRDTTKWNRWESKYISGIFSAAVVLDRTRWLEQDMASRQQVGDLEEFDGGEIRGLRFGAVGTLNFKTPWVYTIFGATNAFDKGFDTTKADDFSWFDYRLDIPLFENAGLSVGKQKEPISMERIMSLAFEPFQERSAAADSLMPSRNLGVTVNGTVLNERMSWSGGVFHNFIDTEENTPTQYVGRLTWLPFISPDESNLVHLGAGVRHTNAEAGVQYRTEPEVDQAPLFVDTGLLAADSALTYNLEASWRKGPMWLSGEYTYTDVDSTDFGKLVFDGYHVAASYVLTGEMRPYRKRGGILHAFPIARGVNQGGWGAWELAARYSNVDLTDGPVDGGDMDIATLGFNWWLTQNFMVNMNYRHVTLDRFGVEGTSNALTGRVMLILQ